MEYEFIKPPEAGGDGKLRRRLLKKVRILFGEVPSHYALLAEIDPEILRDFLVSVDRLIRHATIHPDFFGFLRLYIARRKGFPYCVDFNIRLLAGRGYAREVVEAAAEDLGQIPFDDRLRLLGRKAIKAILDSERFSEQDFAELHEAGWSNRDVYDAIEHGAAMLKNGPIIGAYLKKK